MFTALPGFVFFHFFLELFLDIIAFSTMASPVPGALWDSVKV